MPGLAGALTLPSYSLAFWGQAKPAATPAEEEGTGEEPQAPQMAPGRVGVVFLLPRHCNGHRHCPSSSHSPIQPEKTFLSCGPL